jgi:phosphomannomutase
VIIFGTDGWRAIISDEFTFDNVRKVARSIASYLINHKLASKPLIISYDARFLADKFAEEVVRVMEKAGISCLFTERDTPTPVVAWEVKDKKAAGAVMLTASHNPPEYCGIKFIPDYAGPAEEKITREIEQGITGNSWEKQGVAGKAERFEPRERYLKYIESFVDPSIMRRAKLKVIVDPLHGAGRGYLAKLLQGLGCRVEEIHGWRDVLFGGRNPEPAEENLGELKNKVREDGAVLGLSMDGDADRFGVVDENGKFYAANQIIPLLLDYLVKERGYTGVAVRSVATSHLLDRVAALHKIELFETPVGFKHIAGLMREKEVIIGGEESGGLSIKGHIPEKDGILANLMVVEMLARRKNKLSYCWGELINRVGEVFNLKINLHLGDEQKNALMAKLKDHPPGIGVSKINTIDGIKIIYADGSWVLARPSGTEPLVRIYAESSSQEKARGIVDSVRDLL